LQKQVRNNVDQQQHRPLYRNPYLLYFLTGVILLTLLRMFWPVPEVPPVLERNGTAITVPDFTLIDQDGQPFSAADMEGHVTIVSFFFTRCLSICPTLTRSMKEVQDRLDQERIDPADVRILSISVDPLHDRPEQMRAYAGQHGIDPDRWTQLTGEKAAIQILLERGFLVGMGERTEPTEGLIDIAHSARFVLVDRNRGIRGHYNSEGNERDLILRHAMILAENPDL
jgi:cytochrome oxidase Cu insertion factor (SCO1/SenC/PrrC family)